MRVLLLTAMLAIPASAAPVPVNSEGLFSEPAAPVLSAPAAESGVINPNESAALGLCPPTAAQMAADRARHSGGELFRKLTELPPADMYVAVYRRDANGCENPIVVRYNVGGKR